LDDPESGTELMDSNQVTVYCRVLFGVNLKIQCFHLDEQLRYPARRDFDAADYRLTRTIATQCGKVQIISREFPKCV
jgi:hypothetical protein